jgi:hypothetical protein
VVGGGLDDRTDGFFLVYPTGRVRRPTQDHRGRVLGDPFDDSLWVQLEPAFGVEGRSDR